MKVKVFPVGITTGGTLVVILNDEDAQKMDLRPMDRVFLKKGKKTTTAIVDIGGCIHGVCIVPSGYIGVFEDVMGKLSLKRNDELDLDFAKKPRAVGYIREKLDGKELSKEQIDIIVKDIAHDDLSAVELTYFVAGCYTKGMSLKETIATAKSIVKWGDQLSLKRKIVLDKHCSGGVPGNRTTMIVVPILAAAGITVPKTSSRSITSPSGTADTMEVLAPVTIPVKKMKSIVGKVGACIAWGGGTNIAAADDKLIKVRHNLSLDPEGLLLASILAKKAAVHATHVFIDIPVGEHTKIKTKKEAKHLAKQFLKVGKKLGMKITVITTDGNEPIGKGIGPALEARDVLWVLKNDERGPEDLKEKSLMMAGRMLEIAGVKKGRKVAEAILETGRAYHKMQQIIKAQGGDPKVDPDELPVGSYSKTITAERKGKVVEINSKAIAKIARLAGAPKDVGAGIYLHACCGERVEKGDALFTIYAQHKEKLGFALEAYEKRDGFRVR